ncbi:MAG: LysM peptidoglycan-binding domain-containing protein [Candidatus Dormibacteria bacterium]
MIVDYAPSLEGRRAGLGHRLRRSLALGVVTAGVALVGLASVVSGNSHRPASVVVHRGDTLWAIVATAYPGDDVAARLSDVMAANRRSSPAVQPGETLTLP